MRKERRLALPVCLLLAASLNAGSARGAEFERLEVTEDDGTYRIQASLFVGAPPGAVVRALLDFEEQKAMSPPIRDIAVLGPAPDGGTLVRIVTEICLGPFCRDVKQVQTVRFEPPGAITATTVPDGGDLRSGSTSVEVSDSQGKTRVQLDCTLRPRRPRPFFIPRGWVLSAIRRQARQSAGGLEALAARLASRAGPEAAGPPPAP